ncbi:PP2C family protein-serine/threonine phosphatase [Nocardia huaxiensis]|uniref:Serine/threonine-protein phosphatase n=1 Tax=Nocardia huaxiensis TaxID=2755382 RepID=A0A7D6ZS94_9NOCA|nr:protein phosphatase 2C domain-containing protein [Nocardia huaxiensis]QLY27549.1 serine/threonine-protein phosphatase [Nocardia huaxiensis]UFS99075.1 protein phosphatase 2C domain-containing protein [Nocardia huaxiensis]
MKLITKRVALPPQHADDIAEVGAPVGTSRSTTLRPPYTGTTLSYDPQAPAACESCHGTHFDGDGYCVGCGQLGQQQDRFDAVLGPVCLVTDRGIAHARNEDAVGAAVLDGDRPGVPAAVVIAVCDGVSTSEDPQAASGAAARAGVDAALTALGAGESAEQSVMAGLAAAAQAVRAVGTPDGRSPSCTYVSAVVRYDEFGAARITVANVGDSRAYWLQLDSGGSRRLTLDDSLAQALVETGVMSEENAMDAPHAHVLTRWLGADGENPPWGSDCVRHWDATEPGVLLLCTDGLWNYLPDAEGLARIATGPAPLSAARALADYALLAGGKDNITVALVPVPVREPQGETQ